MLLGTAFVLVAALGAQPDRVQKLADAARSIQPELGANVLLRLVEAKKIAAPAARLKALEDAFALAGAAKYPVQLRGTASWTDNREWSVDRALALGLSATSLRVRVVKEMLPLNGPEARRLFDSIPPPALAPLTCKDTLDYQLDDYIQVMGPILAHGFTEAERKKEVDMAWFGDRIRSMTSPYQLEGTALLLENQRWTKRQLESLISGYNVVMKQMDADPMSLRRTLNYGLQQRMFNLARILLKHEISTVPLLDAYRTLLVRAMRGPRCVTPKRADSYVEMVKLFNSNMRQLTPMGMDPVAAITEEESKPVSTETVGQVHDYWANERTKALMAGQRRLRFGTPEQQAENERIPQRVPGVGNYLTQEQRGEREWEEAFRDYLNQVDRWSKDHGESEEDSFHQLMMIYRHISWLAPAGNLRELVVGRMVALLKTSPVALTSPPEWYVELDSVIRNRDFKPEERRQMREEIKRSGDAAMAVYAELEELVGSGLGPIAGAGTER